MTRSDLIEQLSLRFDTLKKPDVEQCVRIILDGISHALTRNQRTEIRGFGSFSLNHRPPRLGRNPKTGVQVKIPSKYVPHFKAGKDLKDRVDY